MRKRLAKPMLLALIACLLIAGFPAGALGAVTPSFTDMTGHWAANLVGFWADLGLIKGYPDGSFGPERTITRAELCALINRALGLTTLASELPADVHPAAWYAPEIGRAIAAGYVVPDAAGLVDPQGLPTREEMAGMMVLALGLATEAGLDALEMFTDATLAAAAYEGALAELVHRGYLRGFPDGTLQPDATTNRAQAVVLLGRVLGTMHRVAGPIGPATPENVWAFEPLTITTGGVTIRNLMLGADVHITAPSGVVRLENLILQGVITVSGACRVEMHDVQGGYVHVTSSSATVVASGATVIQQTLLTAGSTLEQIGQGDGGKLIGSTGFVWVVVDGLEGRVATLSGNFDLVTLRQVAIVLHLAAGNANGMGVASGAAGSHITLGDDVVVGDLRVEGACRVSGPAAAIERLLVLAPGVEIDVADVERIIVAPGLSARVGGKTYTGGAAVVFEWTFDDGPDGWTGDFVDLPVDYDQDMYELQFRYAELPSEIGPGYGLFIASHNRSDDVFMYIKRALGAAHGILPNTTYMVVIEIDLATNAPAGAVGIGGAPGEALFVKVGAAPREPVPIVDTDDYYRLSVDKGAQNDDGRYAVRVGDGAKSSDDWDWSYEIKTVDNSRAPLLVTTDGTGQLWVFAGTDSGFEGLSELYYARVMVTMSITEHD